MRLGGEGQTAVGVGGRRPGPLGKHLVPYPVQEGGVIPPILTRSRRCGRARAHGGSHDAGPVSSP